MSKNEQFKYRIIEDFRLGKITRMRAAEILGMSERSVSRLAKRVRRDGLKGIKHGNSERKPVHTKSEPLKEEVLEVVRSNYLGFNKVHCLEKLRERHGYDLSYATFWRWCHSESLLVSTKRRKAKNHIYRERMANEGSLLQMDGSPHAWNGKDIWCLLIAIDDATSRIVSAQFCAKETTWDCMALMRSIVSTQGVPEAIYVDKAGWSGGQKRTEFSQFKTACELLDIKVIFAHSAQAKGRVERAFRTLQDRLISELRFAGIVNMELANNFLQQTFLPTYWENQCTVVPRESESRFRSLSNNTDLNQIFCYREQRQIRNDLTIFYRNNIYRVRSKIFARMKGKYLEIRTYSNHSFAFYLENRLLECTLIKQPVRRKNLA